MLIIKIIIITTLELMSFTIQNKNVSNALLTMDSKIECIERCLCSSAGEFIKSRVCGSGVCDGQRSSLNLPSELSL